MKDSKNETNNQNIYDLLPSDLLNDEEDNNENSNTVISQNSSEEEDNNDFLKVKY
jgi:hypothetical protein